MDQKSGLKAILTAGKLHVRKQIFSVIFLLINLVSQLLSRPIITSLPPGFQPLVIENEILGDEVMTDCPAVAAAIKSIGAENVVCIFCTTSCFAPRAPDK